MVERLNNITKINILSLGFMTVMNLLSIFIRGADLSYIFLYIVPFIIAIIILFSMRKYQKQINAWFLTLCGFIISLLGSEGNFSGAIFIVFAFHVDPGRNKTIIRIFLVTVCLALKTLIIPITSIQVINLLFIYYISFGYYYFLFTEKRVQTISEIEDQMEQIIGLLMQGFTIKEISVKTFMTIAAVNKRINRLRDKEGCKTNYQLIYKLSQKRHLHRKIDNIINL